MGSASWLIPAVKRRYFTPSWGLAAAAVLFSVGALATRTGGDRAAAERLLQTVGSAEVAKEPAAKAKEALKRSDDARGAGDTKHGDMLDAVGHQWAEVAADVQRAVAIETELAQVNQAVTEAETKVVRGRVLLEETVARKGRAKSQLDKLDAKSGPGVAKPVKP